MGSGYFQSGAEADDAAESPKPRLLRREAILALTSPYTPVFDQKSRTNIQNVRQTSYPGAGGLANLIGEQHMPSMQCTSINPTLVKAEQFSLSPLKTECSIDTGEWKARQI